MLLNVLAVVQPAGLTTPLNCITVLKQLYYVRGRRVHIEISLQDGVPIYRQIVNQVKYLIASGRLVAGGRVAADTNARGTTPGDA